MDTGIDGALVSFEYGWVEGAGEDSLLGDEEGELDDAIEESSVGEGVSVGTDV